ncbi:DEAD/DEAH box helicase family protein [Escherichia coli]
MADLSKLINMERVQMINPTPIYNKFKYVSAECGSGKTTALCNMINNTLKEGANKQVISSQADSLIKISRIWADFFPANTSNQPI